MKTTFFLFLSALLSVALFADDDLPIKVCATTRAEVAPKIDGRLDDACWQKCNSLGGFTLYGKADPAVPLTFFKTTYTQKEFILAIRCDEPLMNQVISTTEFRDAKAVFSGESIEIFIDPQHSHNDYFQFGINVAGSFYDSRKQDPVWNSRPRIATHRDKTSWSLEFAISWKDLGIKNPQAGMMMGFNICRNRHVGAKQWSNWSRCIQGFHDAPRFAHVVLSPTSKQIVALSEAFRKGERRGTLQIFTDSGISSATYTELTTALLAKFERKIKEFDDSIAAGKTALEQQELRKISDSYKEKIGAIRQRLGKMDAESWTRLELEINKLLTTMASKVAEVRLKILLDQI